MNEAEQNFLVEVFYDYVTKHGLPEVELGDCEDIVFHDAGVFENEKHANWLNAFYILWSLTGETFALVDDETGESFDLGGIPILKT